MSTDYTTYQQHEPLRAPSGWSVQERRFVAQLEELFDDIYRRYNRLRLEDMSPSFRKSFKAIADDGAEMKTSIETTAEGLRLEIERAKIAEGTLTNNLSITAQGLEAEITRAKGIEGELSTSIKTTAEGLNLEVIRAKGIESDLSTGIKSTADDLTTEVARAKGAEEILTNNLSITAQGLEAEITRAKGIEGGLSTNLNITAEGLSTEITRAKGAESDLSTLVKTTAEGITTTVSQTYLSKTDASASYLTKTDASTIYATKSEIIQDDTSWKATFQKIGASGYTAQGITTITENGITVRHTSLSNCYTEMSASGFSIKDASGAIIGGIMTLNGQVSTAMNTLYNVSHSAFKMDIGTYTPYDADTSSGLGASLKYNNVEFMHFGKNIYPSSDYAQYNEIASENGIQLIAGGGILIARRGGSSISFTANDILFNFNNGQPRTVKLSDIWHILD